MQQPARQRQAEERLQQLQLSDGGDAALRQAAIPENKPNPHAEHRDVNQRQPGGAADRRPTGRRRQPGGRQRQRQRHHQRPGDHLPAADPARQHRPFGITQAAQQHRPDHQRIPLPGTAAPWLNAKAPTSTAPTPEKPKSGLGPFSAAQNAKTGGRQRQQADVHQRMRRGGVLQRQRRQQRKTDDHAERHKQQRRQIGPRRPRLPGDQQRTQGQQGGDRRPDRRQKQRIELQHRHSRGGQRAAEDHHAKEAVHPALGRMPDGGMCRGTTRVFQTDCPSCERSARLRHTEIGNPRGDVIVKENIVPRRRLPGLGSIFQIKRFTDRSR